MRQFLTICALLLSAPAFAQDNASMNLALTPAEAVALQRSLDRQPLSQKPAPGFWSLQIKLRQAVEANPEARRAVEAASK
ncbi:hypothetical protein [Bradyrhizobium sp. SBR1B]|uniref:hypothetical protein n=1 Tax=Bradyrhizobium sp. SBR1B TaxID=2663836 RepID=UPI0016066373|nr:hypothetical protein [Bradyrhizobium sp. SBR1B]MBB4378223.1 hypothetical protein [Bradyrhizobium sp. SBR1B]